MAHARRKFHDFWANHSGQIAGEALRLYGALYDIERDVAALTPSVWQQIRQERSTLTVLSACSRDRSQGNVGPPCPHAALDVPGLPLKR